MKADSIPDRNKNKELAVVAPQNGALKVAVPTEINFNNLLEFAFSLESHFQELLESSPSSKQVAREALAILQQLVRVEVRSYSLADGLELFLHKLFADTTISRTIKDLYNDARAVLRNARSATFEIERAKIEIEEILNWYVKRKESLLKIGFSEEEADRIFNVAILQDRKFSGSSGCELSFGLRLIGHAHEQLWAKLFVRKNGELVASRGNCHLWVDDHKSPINSGAVRDVACAVVPILADSQRILIDAVKIFLPYAALDLAAGRTELEFEVVVFNGLGERILATLVNDNIAIPDQLSSWVPPSPQSMGLWATDVVTGDAISNLKISKGYRRMGQTHQIVSIGFDLALFSREADSVFVECRFTDLDGGLVESRVAALADLNSAFFYRKEIYPRYPISRFYGLELQFPLAALALDKGNNQLLFEVSVLLPNNRIICGAVERCELESLEEVPGLDQLLDQYETEVVGDLDNGICLNSVDITAYSEFASAPMLRIAPRFSSTKWADESFRVVCVLEDNEGKVLHNTFVKGEPIVRLLCIGGEPGAESRELVFNIDVREFYETLFGSTASDRVTLRIRLMVYSLNDRLLLDIVKKFKLSRAAASLPAGSPKSHFNPIILSDLNQIAGSRNERVRFTVSIDLNVGREEALKFSLYHDLINAQEESLTAKTSELGAVSQELPGKIQKFDFTEMAAKGKEWFQISLELELDFTAAELLKKSASPRLKVMLFSHNGRLLQAVSYPVSLGGATEGYIVPVKPIISEESASHTTAVAKDSSKVSRLLGWLAGS